MLRQRSLYSKRSRRSCFATNGTRPAHADSPRTRGSRRPGPRRLPRRARSGKLSRIQRQRHSRTSTSATPRLIRARSCPRRSRASPPDLKFSQFCRTYIHTHTHQVTDARTGTGRCETRRCQGWLLGGVAGASPRWELRRANGDRRGARTVTKTHHTSSQGARRRPEGPRAKQRRCASLVHGASVSVSVWYGYALWGSRSDERAVSRRDGPSAGSRGSSARCAWGSSARSCGFGVNARRVGGSPAWDHPRLSKVYHRHTPAGPIRCSASALLPIASERWVGLYMGKARTVPKRE